MKTYTFPQYTQRVFSFTDVPGERFKCAEKVNKYEEKDVNPWYYDGPLIWRFKIGSTYSRKELRNALSYYRMNPERYEVDFITTTLPPKINPENKPSFLVYIQDYYNDSQTVTFIIEE